MTYSSAIDIDLYQAKMLLSYYRSNMHKRVGTMEAFSRKLPNNRAFMVVCGTERIVEYIKNLKFNANDIKLIKEVLDPGLIQPMTDDDCNYFASLDFAKDLTVHTMMDGDVMFANEPVVRISGPIGMCQYVEKHILGTLNHDIRVASKAARIKIAAGDKEVFEYGGRRAHEEISPEAARAAYIAGFTGSSSLTAYAKYGIPVSGTMGHVWIMSHNTFNKTKRQSQIESFKNWSGIWKDSTYLIDTYNTVDGCVDAIQSARRNIGAVRLDSGDLANLSVDVRRELNKSDGCMFTKIVATGDLNEYKILKLRKNGAHIDIYAAGTEVVCTPDAPSCNFVYKLVTTVDDAGFVKDVAKLSSEAGKGTLPCVKQVRRFFDPHSGIFTHDEIQKDGTKLISHACDLLYLRDLKTWDNTKWSVEDARKLFSLRLETMPEYLKLIREYMDYNSNHQYTVKISDDIIKTKEQLLKGE